MVGRSRKGVDTRCPQKRRRVRNSVIDKKILIICTQNQMVANKLQNGPINSSIAPWAARVNCQNILLSNEITYFFFATLIKIPILKTTAYHKYTLKYQKFTQKNVKKRYYRLCSILR
jgi:hypothetical protein